MAQFWEICVGNYGQNKFNCFIKSAPSFSLVVKKISIPIFLTASAVSNKMLNL
ncbi:MAG: hypothetical protein IIA48_07495 [Bacteroidetes bacterium]|nr:hypothetical protein [Bacteroidota bacterium]